jgi:thermitase
MPKIKGLQVVFYSLIISIICFTSVSAVSINSNGNGKQDVTSMVYSKTSVNSENEKFTTDEIIVKVKENITNKFNNSPYAATSAGVGAKLEASIPAFRYFKSKHNIRDISALLPNEESGKGNLITSEDFNDVVAKVKSKYSKRSNRLSDVINTPRLDNIYKIKVPKGKNLNDLCKELAEDASVEYAVPNGTAEIMFTPADPMFSQQWSHTLSNAQNAWDIERGSSQVVVAVIDCGVDYNHEDLAVNMVSGYDYVDIDVAQYQSNGYILAPGEDYTTPDNNPMDFNGHGTHCAGIIAAANNSVGVCGVAPGVKIMPVRAGFSIRNTVEEFGKLEYDDIANAIRYAADHGADIINMSFGSSDDNQLIRDAVQYAASMGVVLVAAAGNDNVTSLSYPAANNYVISVAAVSQNNRKSYYSNYGAWVDIAAPGGDQFVDNQIWSTVPRTGGALTSPSGYRAMQGTSMAAPYISGVAALILSRNTSRSAAQVEQIIKRSTENPSTDSYIGFGKINVQKAVQHQAVNATITITSPVELQTISSEIQNITGTITAPAGSTYRTFYGQGLYPTLWSQIGNGTAPVTNARLGEFSSNMLPPGCYTFKTVVYVSGDSTWNIVHVYVDRYLKSGWPVHLPITAVTEWSNNITLADVNGDNAKDIFIQSQQGVFGYQANGTPLAGWPQLPNSAVRMSSNVITPSPAIGDIDNDGIKEIVAGVKTITTDYLYAWTPSGTVKPGFPITYLNTLLPISSILLADLDNNGTQEIIYKLSFTSGNDQIHVKTSAGANFQSWPYTFNSYDGGANRGNHFKHVMAFDINNDGYKEIIALAFNSPLTTTWPNEKRIYIWNYQGNLLPSYPITIPNSYSNLTGNGNQPIVADIDHDGDYEIGVYLIEGSQRGNNTGSFAYYNLDGSPVAGWPQSFDNQVYIANPIVADLDQDGDLETIFGTMSNDFGIGKVYAFHHNGILVSNWPQSINGDIKSSCIAADINNDNALEIIAVDTKGTLYAWNHHGNLIGMFPKKIGSSEFTSGDGVTSSPAIADVDGDGMLELVASTTSGIVAVWDLSGSISTLPCQWPMDYQNPKHTMDVYADEIVNNNSPVIVNPASASQNPSTSMSTILTVLGSDDQGESGLIYTWEATNASGVPITFSANGTNAAKTTNVTFTRTGNYTFNVTIRDAAGLSVSSSVNVLVTTALRSRITVSAVSASSNETGNPATNAIDNNETSTRWSSIYSDPQWIRFDFGSPQSVRAIVLDWEVANAKNYTIEASNDVSFATKTTLVTKTNMATGNHRIDSLTTGLTGAYRYYRMYGTARNTNYGYSIWDARFYADVPVPMYSLLIGVGNISADQVNLQISPSAVGNYYPSGTVVSVNPVSLNPCYRFSYFTGRGTVALPLQITVAGHTNDVAVFERINYDMIATAGANGSITCSGSGTRAPCGETWIYTFVPNTGYEIDNVIIDGISRGPITDYTFTNISANHTISATFKLPGSYYTLITNAINGSVSRSPAGTSYYHGTLVSLTANPNAGYNFTGWSGDLTGTTNPATISMNTHKTVTANFAVKTYTITASSGANGTVTPTGTTTVNHGGSQTYQITSNAGYEVNSVLVDGNSVGAVTTYTFNNVTSTRTISATFKVKNTITLLSQNKPVYASSSDATNKKENAVDGNTTITRWSATTSTYPQWLTVDLGASHSIDSCKSYFYTSASRSYKYKIETSDNNSTFTTRIDQTARTANGDPGNKFPAGITARYVRITITGSTAGWASLFEFQVFGSTSGPLSYSLTTNGTNGTITLNPAGGTYASGTIVNATAAPNTGYTFTGWSGALTGTTNPGTVTMNANKSLTANFALRTFTISSSTGAGGTITPHGSITVNYNGSQTYQITPNAGYVINDVSVDGSSVGAVSSYTFNNVTSNRVISATFRTPSVSTNLSQGRLAFATASSNDPTNLPRNAFDGNTTGTRWAASTASYPQWIMIDLGSRDNGTSYTIDSCKTFFYNSASRSYKYRIETSMDGINFTSRVDQTARTANGDPGDKLAVSISARFVRITVTGSTAGWASINELQVFGQ